ncbi:unnamed protein product [Diatraea saccharalis]|uniref:Peptidase C1A papain C-terminal domain-containing protein n=1 Tax=Diatraea saccharalis TaxID=40085 RepID=A0A9N9QYZ9_9NEOP|nr:unnamed protein product [Diatraea saccharalis]
MALLYTIIIYEMAGHTLKLPHPLSDEFIDLINLKQTTWRAGRNFHVNTSMKHITKLMGTMIDGNFKKLPVVTHTQEFINTLPDNFDSRNNWPYCPTLNKISDQGSCGSCWAFGAVEAMTDRVCIHSNGTKNFHFSADDLVSCCSYCGNGCEGGYQSAAWEYWKEVGIVSGGPYDSNQGCRSYEIPPCEHSVPGNRMPCTGEVQTPKCKRTCNFGYNVDYKNDKMYGKHVYSIQSDENQIRAELFKNGPVEATFIVYSDFIAFKDGIYKHTQGYSFGGHAVKIIGWGIDHGTKYWLIANSWNTDWGDLNGFFKIIRGENHCNIENNIVAGEPLLVNNL